MEPTQKKHLLTALGTLILGFLIGFFINQSKVTALQNKLAPFEVQEAQKQEAIKNLSTSSGTSSKGALKEAIKNLSH